MQFKDLFSFTNIRNVIIVGVIIFLTLPLIVPEEKSFSVLKKESVIDRDESPLPIFPRENLVEQYTKRLKKLYSFNKTIPLYKTDEEIAAEIGNGAMYADANLFDNKNPLNKANEAYETDETDYYNHHNYSNYANGSNIVNGGNWTNSENKPNNIGNKDNGKSRRAYSSKDINRANIITNTDTTNNQKSNKKTFEEDVSARDLFFSDDYFGGEDLFFSSAANKTQAFIDDTVNLQRGTVLTSDNMLLEPTQEGYYYQGNFYKNGTYPPNANKNAIESALKLYHTKVAGKLGKKALYFSDKNGNLTVGYVKKLPKDISTNIDTYRANNPNGTNNERYSRNSNMYASTKNYNKGRNRNYNKYSDRYRGAHINSLNQSSTNNPDNAYADISAASLQDMHTAYNMAINKINSGEMGQGININPQNNNTNNNGNDNNTPGNSEIGNALQDTNIVIADDPDQPQEHVCEGTKCEESFRIAPKLNEEMSDFYAFYHSFCRETCPAHERILEDDFSSQAGIDELRKELSNSEAQIVELSYVNDNPEYEKLLDNLGKEKLTNQKGEQVEILLRKKEPAIPSNNISFGKKMITPFEQNMKRDFKDQTNPEASIQEIVSRYNQIDKEIEEEGGTQSNNDLMELAQDMLGKDYKGVQIAIVEKSPKKNHYIINGPNIPNGYKTDIPEWEQYKVTKDDSSFYYEVPRNILLNAPTTTAVILVGDKRPTDLKFKGRDSRYVRTVSKDSVYSYNFDKVKETERVILDARMSLIQDMVNKQAIKNQTKNKKPASQKSSKGNTEETPKK